MLRYGSASDTLIGLATRLSATVNSEEFFNPRGSSRFPQELPSPLSPEIESQALSASLRVERLLPFPLTSGIIRVCFDLTGLFRNKDILLC